MLPLNFIFIAGKETAVGENIISIVNRCFLILIKEVEKYLQVFLSRYWRTLPLAYQRKKKRNCNENFGKLSSETSILQSFIQVYFGWMRMRKTTSYERLMSVLNMRKKACLRNFRHVQRCARAIASSYDET